MPHARRTRQTLAQVVGDLDGAGEALGDRLGQRDERVDLARVLAMDDVDAWPRAALGVRAALVAEGIEAGGDHQRRRLAGEIGGAQGRGAQVRADRRRPADSAPCTRERDRAE